MPIKPLYPAKKDINDLAALTGTLLAGKTPVHQEHLDRNFDVLNGLIESLVFAVFSAGGYVTGDVDFSSNPTVSVGDIVGITKDAQAVVWIDSELLDLSSLGLSDGHYSLVIEPEPVDDAGFTFTFADSQGTTENVTHSMYASLGKLAMRAGDAASTPSIILDSDVEIARFTRATTWTLDSLVTTPPTYRAAAVAPVAHASSHESGGSDELEIALSQIPSINSHASTFLGAETLLAQQQALDLEPGVDVQAWDTLLQTIANAASLDAAGILTKTDVQTRTAALVLSGILTMNALLTSDTITEQRNQVALPAIQGNNNYDGQSQNHLTYVNLADALTVTSGSIPDVNNLFDLKASTVCALSSGSYEITIEFADATLATAYDFPKIFGMQFSSGANNLTNVKVEYKKSGSWATDFDTAVSMSASEISYMKLLGAANTNAVQGFRISLTATGSVVIRNMFVLGPNIPNFHRFLLHRDGSNMPTLLNIKGLSPDVLTVSTLPPSPATNNMWAVSDDATYGYCWVIWSGSAWKVFSSGGVTAS